MGVREVTHRDAWRMVQGPLSFLDQESLGQKATEQLDGNIKARSNDSGVHIISYQISYNNLG